MDTFADALTALTRYVSHAHAELLGLQPEAFDADLFQRHADAIDGELDRFHRLLRMLGGSVAPCSEEARACKQPSTPAVINGWSKDKNRLTEREREVLGLIAQGYTNKRGAIALNISHRTFESHRSEVMTKLGARNTAALVRFVC